MQLLKRANFMKSFNHTMKELFNKKDEMGQNRKHIWIDNYTAGINEQLINGNLFTGFLLLMRADDKFIGIITMVRLIGNMLQIFSPLVLEKLESRKKLLVQGRAFIYLLNIVLIGVIPFLKVSSSIQLALVFIITLLVTVFGAIIAPGYAVWHIKSIPQRVRTSFFSFSNMANGFITIIAAYLAGKFADILKAGGRELTGFTILRVVAVAVCFIDLYHLSKIKEYPNEKSDTKINLKSIFISPFKEKRYLITVLIACMWSFSASIPGPYFTIYLLKDLHVQYSYLSLVNMMYLVALIVATPFWSKRLRKTSYFKTLCLLMSVFLFHYIALAFVGKNTLFIYFIAISIIFIFSVGINLVFANMPFINIPEGNQTNFIGFYSTMNNIAAFLGVTVGTQFITHTEKIHLSLFGVTMQNKQYILLLTSALMMLSVICIYILQKQDTKAHHEHVKKQIQEQL